MPPTNQKNVKKVFVSWKSLNNYAGSNFGIVLEPHQWLLLTSDNREKYNNNWVCCRNNCCNNFEKYKQSTTDLLKLNAEPFTWMITIGINTKTMIFTTCAHVPALSLTISAARPFSINKHIVTGTIESKL